MGKHGGKIFNSFRQDVENHKKTIYNLMQSLIR